MAVNMVSTPPITGGVIDVYPTQAFSYDFSATVPVTEYQYTGSIPDAVFFGDNLTSGGLPTVSQYPFIVDGIQPMGTLTYTSTGTSGISYMGDARGITGFGNDYYVADRVFNSIVKFTGGTTPSFWLGSFIAGFSAGTGTSASLNTPATLTYDSNSNVFYVGSKFGVMKVTTAAVATVLAGSDTAGFVNANGASARFGEISQLDYDNSGNVYVADAPNRRIRKITPSGDVTTFAGSGTIGYLDSTNPLTARFDSPNGIAINRSNNDIYVYDNGNYCIRKISGSTGAVTTFAGSNVFGFVDGIGTAARFDTVVYGIGFRQLDNCLYVIDTARVRKVTVPGAVVTTFLGSGNTTTLASGTNLAPPGNFTGIGFDQSQTMLISANATAPFRVGVGNVEIPLEVRPAGTRPTLFTIAATTGNVLLNVDNPITIVTANPPIVNGVATLYKFSPFQYAFSNLQSGQSFTVTAPPELTAFVSISGSTATFSSTTGFQTSYSSLLPISFNALLGSNVVDSFSFNVQVLPGRFFPPAAGASNTFYQNEAISPILFKADISLNQIYSSPSLPPGLSLVQLDASGSQYQLQGTPAVQSAPTTYNIVGRNTQNGRIVSVLNSYRVDPERIRLNSIPSSNVTGMLIGTPIATRTITALYPTYGAYTFQYRWTQVLPDGLQVENLSGNPVVSGFSPTDVSSSIRIAGTPTLAAAQLFRMSNITAYPFTLTANLTRGTSTLNATIPFTFSFAPTVLFTQEPSNVTLYLNDIIDSNDGFAFRAGTFFTSGTVNISRIFSPNLRSDLSLQFVPGSPLSTAYLVSATGATFSEVNQPYTIRAINMNGLVRDTVVNITTQPDVVTFTPPTDICSTFIFSRSLANGKVNYYNSPINFRATSSSGRPVTYSDGGTLAGTGLSLSNIASNNSVRLVGTPIATRSLTNLTITATADQTFATGNTTVQLSIIPDSASWAVSPSYMVTLETIQNVEITPYQFRATTLSELPIAYYSASNLPVGTNISSAGRLTGIPTIAGPGMATIIGNTGYSALTYDLSYNVLPDEILFVTPSTTYPITPGQPIPDIPITAFSYSGIFGSNFTLDPSGNPTYGITVTSTGTIYGTAVTQVDPTLLYPDPPIPLYVSAVAGTVSGTFAFLLGTTNPGSNPSPYLYFSNQTGPAFPTQETRYTLYQYGETTITITPPGTSPYLYIYPTDLPRGLRFNGITGVISGNPTELVLERSVRIHALQRSTKLVSSLTLYITVLSPFVTRPQTSAAAYTSLIRQYTLANATQNSRDYRIFAGAERTLGAFAAGEGADVTTAIVPGCDPNCPAPVVPTVSFSPLEIDGCNLWLDALDFQTLDFKGGEIERWEDKSGQGNHANKRSGDGATYTLSSINGKPGVTFSIGTSMRGSLSNSSVYASAFAVFKSQPSLNLDPSFGYHPILSTARANDIVDVTLLANVGGEPGKNEGDSRILTDRLGLGKSILTTKGVPILGESWYDGAVQKVATSGVESTSNVSTGNFSYVRYALGRTAGLTTLATLPWIGHLGEVVVYNNVLSISNRQKIEGYLAWKWGLEASLPSDHPYINAPPKGIPGSPTYSITQNVNQLFEGQSAIFTVTTTNVPDGTLLYWTTTGTATALDFTDGVSSGSFLIVNGIGKITRTAKIDFISEVEQSFLMRIRTGSTTGTIVATSDSIPIYNSENYTWTEKTSAPEGIYEKLAVTSDFTTMIATGTASGQTTGGPYVSRNQGTTWARKVSGITFSSSSSVTADVVVAKENPLIMYCVNGGTSNENIYKSVNGGETWTVTSAPATRWQSVACSGNGSVILASPEDNGQFYISRDGGATWSAGPYTGSNWRDCAMSMDGTRMYVVRVGSQNIHRSTDSGYNWSTVGVGVNLYSVDCSADGLKVIVGTDMGSTIRISSNGGQSFTTPDNVAGGETFFCVSVSDDGKGLVALGTDPQQTNSFNLSVDGGTNWSGQSITTGRYWRSVGMNLDATKIFAGSSTGKPYVGIPPL